MSVFSRKWVGVCVMTKVLNIKHFPGMGRVRTFLCKMPQFVLNLATLQVWPSIFRLLDCAGLKLCFQAEGAGIIIDFSGCKYR